MSIKDKNYTELNHLENFDERFKYLKLDGSVGDDTFGCDRYLNQSLYKSSEWKRVRAHVIARDNGCELGIKDMPIRGTIHVHHINPLTKEDILEHSEKIFDPENLICVSHETHNALHYGDMSLLDKYKFNERSPNDTCPWKKGG